MWKIVRGKVVWQSRIWERWTHLQGGCHQVPRLPRQTKVNVAKRHACHANRTSMSPSATPATQSAAASRATNGDQARHQTQPRVWKLWQVLGAQFFETIVLMKFVLKNPCQQLHIFSVAPCERSYACPINQWLHAAWQVLGAQFSGTIALMEFVLKNPCEQLCSFGLALCQRSYACPINQWLHAAWQVLGAQFFGTIALMEFVLKNLCEQLCSFGLALCQRSYACPIAQCLHTAWQVLGAQFFGTIALMEFVLKTCANSSRFPLHIAPSHRSSPKLFLTVSRPSTLSSLPSRSLPTQLTPPDPAQRHKRHACHANGTWMSISATPATRNASGCRQVPRLPRKVPRRPGRPTGTKPATRCSPVP